MLDTEFTLKTGKPKEPLYSDEKLEATLGKGINFRIKRDNSTFKVKRPYTDEEKAEIEQTVGQIFQDITKDIEPERDGPSQMRLVVGPPASGKSTFINNLMAGEDTDFALVDYDDIRNSYPMFEREKQNRLAEGDTTLEADHYAYEVCSSATNYIGKKIRNKLYEAGYNIITPLTVTGFISGAEKYKEVTESGYTDIRVDLIGADRGVLLDSAEKRSSETGRNVDPDFFENQIKEFPNAIFAAADAPFDSDLYWRYGRDEAPEHILSADCDGNLSAETSKKAFIFFKKNIGLQRNDMRDLMDTYRKSCGLETLERNNYPYNNKSRFSELLHD